MATREIARSLWRLSWPLAITLQLVTYSDALVVFWLGQLLGPDGLAVEATLRYASLCAVAVMVGVATGVSVLVSQSVGARDGRGLTIIANGLATCGVLWLAMLAIVLPLIGPIGELLGSRDVGAPAVRAYLVPWLLLTLPAIGLLQVLLQAASGAGWTRLSLTRAVADLALTAIAVPVAIGALGLGLAGAPVATGLVQLAVAALVWRALSRARDRWGLGEPRRRLDRALCVQLLDIGMPPQLTRVAMLGGYAYLVQHVAADGRTAVAAFGVALSLIFVAFNLTSALARGAGILVGQGAGARAWDRVRASIRTAVGSGTLAGIVLALVFGAAGRPLAALFTDDAAVVDGAAATLRVLAWAIPFTAVSQVLLFVFVGMKASKLPGLLGIAADAAGIAFAVWWPADHRLEVVAWSIVLSNALRTVLYVVLWRWRLVARIDALAAQAVSSTNSE